MFVNKSPKDTRDTCVFKQVDFPNINLQNKDTYHEDYLSAIDPPLQLQGDKILIKSSRDQIIFDSNLTRFDSNLIRFDSIHIARTK